MKSTTQQLRLSHGEVTYTLTRKNVKNINMRIKSDGSICVSANSRVSVSYIESFLKSKEEFIFSAMKKIEESRCQSLDWGVEYGKKLPMFGDECSVFLIPSVQNKAYKDHNALIIETVDTEDKRGICDCIVELYRDLIEDKITETFWDIYYRVFPEAKNPPSIKFRKMVSMWGNCSPSKNTITFSVFLAALPMDCIEYVIYHEIVHLIHADHSKKFYDTLAIFLPDWSERKHKMRSFSEIMKIF